MTGFESGVDSLPMVDDSPALALVPVPQQRLTSEVFEVGARTCFMLTGANWGLSVALQSPDSADRASVLIKRLGHSVNIAKMGVLSPECHGSMEWFKIRSSDDIFMNDCVSFLAGDIDLQFISRTIPISWSGCGMGGVTCIRM